MVYLYIVTALYLLENYIFLRRNRASNSELVLVSNLLEHILKKNYFTFNNETYLQISGTAMGTRCAPNCAIIMAELEEELLSQTPMKPRI